MGATPITIVERATGRAVEAELLGLLAPQDLMLLEEVWRPERSRILRALLNSGAALENRPESLSWNWRAKAQHLRLSHASGFAVVCEEQWQGAMLTKSGTYPSRLENGKPLVYIDFLEVAPWNWTVPDIGQESRYGLVGTRLFERAVRQSWEEGYDGRVALHSLPQSESYYQYACGMTPLGADDEDEGLTYFELSRDNASRILEQMQ